ncbi:hypothetical protein HII31_07533 [Pseudocercospora fuligena]|uniref:Lipocalin-like domain-containing protein n=1 Tax=Pseudocercospora fuligena TaxID=685502 RepID=A0A8H6VG74_9PEZI|nr:hypothetical protein HII31_07533 [Pseudocercospora fuligena]
MAAPSSKFLENLSGNWTLNKSLSDDPTPALELQGVNYLIKKAATSASVHLKVTQPDKDHISMKQNATSFKIPGTSEDYTLDWTWRDDHDPVFGDLKGRSRWVSEADLDGKDVELVKKGKWDGDVLVQAEGNKSDGSWGGTHFGGFEEVGGERRHVRWIRIWTRDGEEVVMRMVYDFDGE